MRTSSARRTSPLAATALLLGAALIFTGCGDSGSHMPAGSGYTTASANGGSALDSVLGTDPGPSGVGVSSGIEDPVLAGYDGVEVTDGSSVFATSMSDLDNGISATDPLAADGLLDDPWEDDMLPAGYGGYGGGYGYGTAVYGGYGGMGGYGGLGGMGGYGMDGGIDDPDVVNFGSDMGGLDAGLIDDPAGVGMMADIGGPIDPGLDIGGMDAGFVDTGFDAGFDVGMDAGPALVDPGFESGGFDAAPVEMGFDAGGFDGGMVDAGVGMDTGFGF